MRRFRSGPLPVQLNDALKSDLDALPDVELLDRFVGRADHAAFEVLVRRYGPMVLGVCRRMLGNVADADDAFQATFLVLIRKAHALRRAAGLGPWLYAVAHRVALKARARAARHAAIRTDVVDDIADPSSPSEVPDWLPILDAELLRLPGKYRDALVLCELQGAPRGEAARALGVPEGTLSSRLSRGREMLRKRLLKHGALLPGLAGLFGAGGVCRATVPAALLARVLGLSEVVAGAAPSGAVSVGAAQLKDEVLRGMFVTKLRGMGAALVALVLVSAGLVSAWPTEAPPGEKGTKVVPPPEAKAPAAPVDPRPADKKAVAPKPGDRDALQGLWVSEEMELGGPKEGRFIGPVGEIRILVVGDTWWWVFFGTLGVPEVAKLDTTKNPKWLDLTRVEPKDEEKPELQKWLYELDGDRLTLCVSEKTVERPTEINPGGKERTQIYAFRRGKAPPAAGDQALLGSWVGKPTVGFGKEKGVPRAEFLDGGFLFFQYPGLNKPGSWLGGPYTVDATKNPKQIWLHVPGAALEVDTGRFGGSYEKTDGGLKLVLRIGPGRDPQKFAKAKDVAFLDLRAAPVEAPAPRALGTQKPPAKP